MLILTRKVDQGIVIQGNILVTVLRVERDRVKLGISAPEEITVLREELLQRGAGGNREADPANSNDDDPPPVLHYRLPNRARNRASEGSSAHLSGGD